MDITVDIVNEDTLDEFWNLYSSCITTDFPGYSPQVIAFFLEKLYTKTSFRYWMMHNMKTIYVAKINNTIVGFAVVDEPYGGVSFCRWLGVKKNLQKKGIGTQLISRWLADAKAIGCHKAELAAQLTARKFYQKVGLIEEGLREKSYFGIDQYVFGKVLGHPNMDVMISYK